MDMDKEREKLGRHFLRFAKEVEAIRRQPHPPAAFQRFQEVVVVRDTSKHGGLGKLIGETGVVLWQTFSYFGKPSSIQSNWRYSVYFPGRRACYTVLESMLEVTGGFDALENHLGSGFEISYDVVMEPDMTFVEGCYRLPGMFWQVFCFAKGSVAGLGHSEQTWESGITGVTFDVPQIARLNREYVERAMCDRFGCTSWMEVRGPDSMVLR